MITSIFGTQRGTVSLVIVFALTSFACVGLSSGPFPATQPSETQSSGSPPGELTTQQKMTFGPGPFIYTDTTAGLAELSSYRSKLTVSFDGVRDGQPEQWTKTYNMQSTKEPRMRTMTIETTGNIPAVEPMFLAQASGLEYQRQGESICAASVLAEEESPSKRLEPASMLTGVIGADQAGSETVNEIAADHHTFDQRALGEEGLTESTGEMWVASNGGYIVRYRLSSKAGADYFGEGIEGTLTMEYEISEVNQPLALDLPDDCPPGFVDTPLMENAQGVEKYPGMTLFSTPSDLKAVTDFYEKILTESGWQADGDPAVTEEAAILQFSRDALHLSIVAGKNDTGTEVRLMIVQPTELNFQLP